MAGDTPLDPSPRRPKDHLAREVVREDGSRVREWYGGTVEVIHANGETMTTFPDGTTRGTYLDGTTRSIYPSGSTSIRYRDGTERTNLPDGTFQVEYPNGRLFSYDQQGKVIPSPPRSAPVAPAEPGSFSERAAQDAKDEATRTGNFGCTPRVVAAIITLVVAAIAGVVLGGDALRDDDDGRGGNLFERCRQLSSHPGEPVLIAFVQEDCPDDDDDETTTTARPDDDTTTTTGDVVRAARLDGVYLINFTVTDSQVSGGTVCTEDDVEATVRTTGEGDDRQITMELQLTVTADLDADNSFTAVAPVTGTAGSGTQTLDIAFDVDDDPITLSGTSVLEFRGDDGVPQVCSGVLTGSRIR